MDEHNRLKKQSQLVLANLFQASRARLNLATNWQDLALQTAQPKLNPSG